MRAAENKFHSSPRKRSFGSNTKLLKFLRIVPLRSIVTPPRSWRDQPGIRSNLLNHGSVYCVNYIRAQACTSAAFVCIFICRQYNLIVSQYLKSNVEPAVRIVGQPAGLPAPNVRAFKINFFSTFTLSQV